ncbi:MAG: hypothetical protein HQL56_00995 [Magnetococcales bacterium]|nr:hypothetical protein [Magnetococcales bacterium]
MRVLKVEPIEKSGMVLASIKGTGLTLLASWRQVVTNDIRVGDEVHLIKNGGVIKADPQEGQVRGRVSSKPEFCPCCGKKVAELDGYLWCPKG